MGQGYLIYPYQARRTHLSSVTSMETALWLTGSKQDLNMLLDTFRLGSRCREGREGLLRNCSSAEIKHCNIHPACISGINRQPARKRGKGYLFILYNYHYENIQSKRRVTHKRRHSLWYFIFPTQTFRGSLHLRRFKKQWAKFWYKG